LFYLYQPARRAVNGDSAGPAAASPF